MDFAPHIAELRRTEYAFACFMVAILNPLPLLKQEQVFKGQYEAVRDAQGDRLAPMYEAWFAYIYAVEHPLPPLHAHQLAEQGRREFLGDTYDDAFNKAWANYVRKHGDDSEPQT